MKVVCMVDRDGFDGLKDGLTSILTAGRAYKVLADGGESFQVKRDSGNPGWFRKEMFMPDGDVLATEEIPA